ncbi:hypothetical protein ACY5GL_001878 [Cronobacter malonaticus]
MDKIKPTDVLKNSLESTTYNYSVKLDVADNVQSVVLLTGCYCNTPEENYPFHQPVFDWLKSISVFILKYANKFSIPPIAIAGALADEYNTRFSSGYSLAKKTLDNLQDNIYPKGKYIEYPESINNSLSSQELDEQYEALKDKDPDNVRRTSWDRASNAVAGDYGKGNISLRTAYDIYDASPKLDDFPEMSRLDILRYLVTDEGTVHFAAISIMLAQRVLQEHISNLPPRKKEATLITYFKQGDHYRAKFLNNLKMNSNAQIKSGEGCRTCFQREKIADCIGVSVKKFNVYDKR